MTPEQIEIAARKLCESKGRDPDDLITFADGALLNPPQIRWRIAARDIQHHLSITDAIKYALEVAA